MDDPDVPADHLPTLGGSSERSKDQRVTWEAELLAQARRSAAMGRTVSEEDVDAWIDSLGTEHELPPPHSGR